MKWLDSLFADFERLGRRRLNLWSRLLLLIGVVCLILTYFFPLWTIELEAPQYQDNLYLDIYSYQLSPGGDGQHLQEINTLNHYIGMQKVQESDFTEMTWMPFAIGFFVVFAFRALAFGRMSSVIDTLVLFLYFSLFSMANFVYRLYSYGHDLDPSAAINMDPFMPAVIGMTEVANFTQYSIPRMASYLMLTFLIVVILAIFVSRNEPTVETVSEDSS